VRAVEVQGTDIEVRPLSSGEWTGWRADAVRAAWTGPGIEVSGRRAPGFQLRSLRPMRLNGREYASVLDLVESGGGIAVVNELPLEEYVVGVVQAEAGERWPAEALRAQAIVARTYGAYHRTIGASRPYHVVASTAHQQYAGRVPPGSSVWAAVQNTGGQVLRWQGDLFPAFYHTESGGLTEDPRLVFSAPNMPALKPIACPFSVGSPHFYWSLELRLDELAQLLRRHGVDIGTVTTVEVSERTPSLRAVAVTVRGTRAAARLRGNDFRRIVGYDALKSTLFAVAQDGQAVRFSGRGYGHGVGLCQWGAKAMAEQGYTARQILEFYYPGAVLGLLNGR
jgi:stage II sporulation protein D